MSSHNILDLNWVLSVFRRWWWLMVGLTVVAVIAARVVTFMMTPVYNASATLLIDPAKGASDSQYNTLVTGERLALTYGQMVKERPVLETVIAKLGLKMSPESLAGKLTIEPVKDTQLLRLTVGASSATQAADIANALAQALSERVQAVSTQRYEGSLKNAKDKLDTLQAQMNDTQSQITALQTKKIDNDVKLSQLSSALDVDRSDYRALQTSYQSLQLTVTQVTGTVYVVQPVQVEKSMVNSFNSATAVVSVGQTSPMNSTAATERLILTYTQLLLNRPLLEGVIKDLGLSETPDALARSTRVEMVINTQFVRIIYDNPDPVKGKQIAEAMVKSFIEKVKATVAEPYNGRLTEMEKQLNDLSTSIDQAQAETRRLTSENTQLTSNIGVLQTNLNDTRTDFRTAQQDFDTLTLNAAKSADTVVITEPAHTPKRPSQNNSLYILLAGAVGLALGLALSFWFGYTDDRIRNHQDLSATLDVPILGSIGKLTGPSELVVSAQPNSFLAEDFRVLGTNVRIAGNNGTLRTLLVTSPTPADGKSVVSANLAVALARAGLKVIVVDADLRLPRIHELFKLNQDEGFSSSLMKGSTNGCLQPTQVDGLKVLTSGGTPEYPAEALSSPHLKDLLENLSEKADVVLLDCPPVLAAADTGILASQVDAVLLVVRAGQTEGQIAREAVAALRQVNANVIGVVLNDYQTRTTSYSHYYGNRKKHLQSGKAAGNPIVSVIAQLNPKNGK